MCNDCFAGVDELLADPERMAELMKRVAPFVGQFYSKEWIEKNVNLTEKPNE